MHPLIFDTSQTGNSFQIAGTVDFWTIPILTYWGARKQRGSISAHQSYLHLKGIYQTDILLLICNSMCSLFQKTILPICFPEPCDTVPVPLLSLAGCTAAPRNTGHRSPVKSQWELEGSPWRAALGEEQFSSTGTLPAPTQPRCGCWHEWFAVTSQPGPRQGSKDRQGLLLSCQKNVTRKQPHTLSPLVFSFHLFSSISDSLLQKALLKALSLQFAN